MPVIKANAYGHGAVEVARVLESRCPALAVACCDEAVTLRDAGITRPIMLLEGIFTREELQIASHHGFWIMLHSDQQLQLLEITPLPKPVRCWIKLDTGMHRLGFRTDQAADLLQRVQACDNTEGEVVLATHLACADEPGNPLTQDQLTEFALHTGALKAPCSIANSPGLLAWPTSRRDWNRPGVMLYGQSPFKEHHGVADQLLPVMTLRSAVMALRDIPAGDGVGYGGSWVAQRPSRIATVPIGYGDGYPRAAKSGTPVLVNGQRVPLVGRVSMDMITVDVTDLAETKLGDSVTLWGDKLTANDIAQHTGTISYEITTRLLPRVPREYIGDRE